MFQYELAAGKKIHGFVQADFLANLAAYDAGIVIWQEKARWNAVRPFSAISHIYGDECAPPLVAMCSLMSRQDCST